MIMMKDSVEKDNSGLPYRMKPVDQATVLENMMVEQIRRLQHLMQFPLFTMRPILAEVLLPENE